MKSASTTGLLRGSCRVRVSREVRKGAWSQEEDLLLRKCIEKYGEGKWRQVSLKSGLNRCRKSCRLRWLNYLRPDIKRGEFKSDEVDLIIRMHKLLGNRWSLIAGRLPGRTANDIKNYSNTHLKKMLFSRNGHHQNHDQLLLEAAADHENKMFGAVKPKAIKVLKTLPRTFSLGMKLFHKQLQHFEGCSSGLTNNIYSDNINKICTSSASPIAPATEFDEELLNSVCGDDDDGSMDFLNNINTAHWDDYDLHLDDNLWSMLDIEREFTM